MKFAITPLEELVEHFESLPGIGKKTAQRLAYYVLNQDKSFGESFAKAIQNAQEKIKRCPICHNLTDGELCYVCADTKRDRQTICVVEDSKDLMAFERTGEYKGLYHVLGGLISPMDGIGVEQLFIAGLLKRVTDNDIVEVIMATNPTLEGEATAMYISKLLQPFAIKVTRLAYGIPVGGNLEYADEVTLFKALENRSVI